MSRSACVLAVSGLIDVGRLRMPSRYARTADKGDALSTGEGDGPVRLEKAGAAIAAEIASSRTASAPMTARSRVVTIATLGRSAQ